MREFRTLFCCGLWFLSSFQQSPIRVEVEAVNVLVSVTDRKDRFVTNLGENRFHIYENGIRQRITNFTHETELPLRIALLIDTSSSVRLKLEFEKKAATHFLRMVMRPPDRALLVEFDSGVSLRHDFTSSAAAITKEIRALRAGGGTALLDALYTVSREKMTDPGTRQAIVILSDGVDQNSEHTLEKIVEAVHRSGAIIYAIGTTRFGADVQKEGEETLEKLAEETGGRAFFPYSTETLSRSFEALNEELRSQYSLTYVSRNRAKDGTFRKFEVKLVKGKGLSIRHRKGYYAATADSG